MESVANSRWSGKTDGMPWMQRSLVFMFRILNLRVFYAIMACVIPFYMLVNHQGYISIYRYFRKRHSNTRIRAFTNVYLNHFVFGQIILDRFAAYAGHEFNITIRGVEYFNELVDSPHSFMMLSSHVGNYELAGYHLKPKAKTINALVYIGETETVMENRRKMFSGKSVNMIPVKADMSHIFLINEAISNGDVVSMPADRLFGSPRFAECDFFGERAKFPLGPFVIGAQRNLPLLAIFVMKESVNDYTIHVSKIERLEQAAPLKEKANILAQKYAGILEDILKVYPTQWFNYYNFWE